MFSISKHLCGLFWHFLSPAQKLIHVIAHNFSSGDRKNWHYSHRHFYYKSEFIAKVPQLIEQPSYWLDQLKVLLKYYLVQYLWIMMYWYFFVSVKRVIYMFESLCYNQIFYTPNSNVGWYFFLKWKNFCQTHLHFKLLCSLSRCTHIIGLFTEVY